MYISLINYEVIVLALNISAIFYVESIPFFLERFNPLRSRGHFYWVLVSHTNGSPNALDTLCNDRIICDKNGKINCKILRVFKTFVIPMYPGHLINLLVSESHFSRIKGQKPLSIYNSYVLLYNVVKHKT